MVPPTLKVSLANAKRRMQRWYLSKIRKLMLETVLSEFESDAKDLYGKSEHDQ
jgi:hypothetical protein